jgi:hypothetical protein
VYLFVVDVDILHFPQFHEVFLLRVSLL